MQWKEIKTWAISYGYHVERNEIEESTKKYIYTWHNKSRPNNQGRAESVLDLAKCIYNDITDHKHVEYQKKYEQEQLNQEIFTKTTI